MVVAVTKARFQIYLESRTAKVCMWCEGEGM